MNPDFGEQSSSSTDTLNLVSTQLINIANGLLASKLSPSDPSDPNQEEFTCEDRFLDAATPLFATLKALNRSSSGLVVESKAKTQQARNELDQVHLGLQNLIYERRHLEKEIKKCQEFESEFQNISIHPLEEYFARNPEDNTHDIDPHELMIKRLKYELSERKRFEAEKKELLQKKLKLSKENDEKKSKLDDLEKQLDRFVSSAKEIQAKMATQV
ncbi:hypothetical protein O181_084816 [Austropuccinia psidii MF-1]|uniref:Fms interacting protein n=1 Tax=Austropuccinia psidii MF-1 TaxID=1389203 RepID=A0A9Q3FRQ2_9BASI|nr:hypothetical protein [Austropuccinia psidii MF-1]